MTNNCIKNIDFDLSTSNSIKNINFNLSTNNLKKTYIDPLRHKQNNAANDVSRRSEDIYLALLDETAHP